MHCCLHMALLTLVYLLCFNWRVARLLYGPYRSLGKTHTIQGTASDAGLLPRALAEIFSTLAHRNSRGSTLSEGVSIGAIISGDLLANNVSGSCVESDSQLQSARSSQNGGDNATEFLGSSASDISLGFSASNCELQSALDDAYRQMDSLSMSGSTTSLNTANITCNNITSSSVNSTAVDSSVSDNLAVVMSYLEVYEDRLVDLFATMAEADDVKLNQIGVSLSLRILAQDDGSVFVSGLREVRPSSLAEALALLQRGQANRQVACTSLNKESSRSHSVLTVKLVHASRPLYQADSGALVSKLCVVDLAGSERQQRTQGNSKRVKEAGKINQSLMLLGRCLTAMRHNQNVQAAAQATGANVGAITSLPCANPTSSIPGDMELADMAVPLSAGLVVVPFRESKITHLLQDYLQGYGRTAMLMTASDEVCDFDETYHALKYAAVASEITMQPSHKQILHHHKASQMKQVRERQRELVERKAAAAREKENTLALVQLQAQALVTHAQEETTQRLKKPKFAVLTTTPGRQAHQGMRDIVVSTSHQKPSRAIVAVPRVTVEVSRKVATTVVIEESDSQANDSESQLSAFEDDFTHGDDEESDGSDDDDNENHENQMVQEMYILRQRLVEAERRAALVEAEVRHSVLAEAQRIRQQAELNYERNLDELKVDMERKFERKLALREKQFAFQLQQQPASPVPLPILAISSTSHSAEFDALTDAHRLLQSTNSSLVMENATLQQNMLEQEEQRLTERRRVEQQQSQVWQDLQTENLLLQEQIAAMQGGLKRKSSEMDLDNPADVFPHVTFHESVVSPQRTVPRSLAASHSTPMISAMGSISPIDTVVAAETALKKPVRKPRAKSVKSVTTADTTKAGKRNTKATRTAAIELSSEDISASTVVVSKSTRSAKATRSAASVETVVPVVLESQSPVPMDVEMPINSVVESVSPQIVTSSTLSRPPSAATLTSAVVNTETGPVVLVSPQDLAAKRGSAQVEPAVEVPAKAARRTKRSHEDITPETRISNHGFAELKPSAIDIPQFVLATKPAKVVKKSMKAFDVDLVAEPELALSGLPPAQRRMKRLSQVVNLPEGEQTHDIEHAVRPLHTTRGVKTLRQAAPLLSPVVSERVLHLQRLMSPVPSMPALPRVAKENSMSAANSATLDEAAPVLKRKLGAGGLRGKASEADWFDLVDSLGATAQTTKLAAPTVSASTSSRLRNRD